MRPVQFSADDLRLFREASHDANPLHVDREYARKTPYGEQVVFGALGALASLGALETREGAELSELDFEFRNPLHIGPEYGLEVLHGSEEEALVQLTEGDRVMSRLRFRFRLRTSMHSWAPPRGIDARRDASVRTAEELSSGQVELGSYAPSPGAFAQLVDRWRLRDRGMSDAQVAALIWSSYFVGMELPGREAMFWKLRMQFQETPVSGTDAPLDYEVRLREVDRRFDLLHCDANLALSGRPFATARIAAFVRGLSPRPDVAALTLGLEGRRFAAPKTAMVVGGSRGLGAALSVALAVSGAHVYLSYRQSREEAGELEQLVAGAAGRIEAVPGDASDAEWIGRFAKELSDGDRGLDLLICNASPTIGSLPFAPEAIPRLHRFVGESLDLVAAPLAAFLPSLAERKGTAVLISSQALRTLPAPWPHYVTAKAAAEGLVHWAAAHYKDCAFLIVRPPKLLTSQTNTPMGRQDAMRPDGFAAALVRRLHEPHVAGKVEILEQLGS